MPLADYKIAVRILAVNGVSAVVRQIAKDMIGLGTSVDAIGTKFGRWRIAILGMGALVGTLDIALARAGDKIVQQQRLLRASGVPAGQVAGATGVAEQTSIAIPGTTTAGNLHLQRELYTALGSLDLANQALPLVAKNVAALAMAHLPGPENTIALLKALDLFGAGIRGGRFDPQEFARNFQFLTQLQIMTSGLLPPNMMMRIAQLGGFAAQMGGNPREFLIDMLSGFLQLGTRAGSGLAQVANQLIGGQATRKTVFGLEQYGLVSRGGIVDEAGHYAIKPGALLGYQDLLQHGIQFWFQRDLIPVLRAHGATSAAQIIAAVEQIFGSVRAQRLVLAYTTPAGALMSQREIQLAIQAQSGQPYEQLAKTFEGSLYILRHSLSNFFQILGQPNVTPTVRFLNSISDVIQQMTSFAVKNPAVMSELGKVIFALSAALTALGGFAVVTALISLAGPGGLIFALAAAIAALGAAFGQWSPRVLGMVMGVGTGAAIGAGIGSVVPGIGTAAGAVAGGLIGGLAGAIGTGLLSQPANANIRGIIDKAAIQYGIPVQLLERLAVVESHLNPKAVGPKNPITGLRALGLMQLEPMTGQLMGVKNPFDPTESALGGAHYLANMLKEFHGNWAEALAAYNWGPGNVEQAIKIGGARWLSLAPTETQQYVGALLPYTVASKNAPQTAATPSPLSSDPGPLHVILDNGQDLAAGVTKVQARELQRNPSGPTGHNPSRGFYPPGISQTPIMLP